MLANWLSASRVLVRLLVATISLADSLAVPLSHELHGASPLSSRLLAGISLQEMEPRKQRVPVAPHTSDWLDTNDSNSDPKLVAGAPSFSFKYQMPHWTYVILGASDQPLLACVNTPIHGGRAEPRLLSPEDP